MGRDVHVDYSSERFRLNHAAFTKKVHTKITFEQLAKYLVKNKIIFFWGGISLLSTARLYPYAHFNFTVYTLSQARAFDTARLYTAQY